VFSRRYPHAETGRIVAPVFALAGAVGGIVSALLVKGGPPGLLNVMLWAALGGFTGYIVFSSEGPRQRPGGAFQSAAADGIVAGVITVVSASVIDVIIAAGAGTSTTQGVSTGTFLKTAGLGALIGVVAGTALGFLVVPIVGRERLQSRVVVAQPRRQTKRKRKKR
jgi:hypothetical protein